MATKEELLSDIERVNKARGNKEKEDYFNKNYGGIDKYISNQTDRLNSLTPVQPKGQMTISSTPNNAQSYIDQLSKAREQQAIAGLDKARSQAISNLSKEESTIKPQYYEKKRQTHVQSQNQARNFSEYLAQRGLQSSGLAGEGEIDRLSSLQGAIGGLRQQEQQAFDDIARRRSDTENAYLSDVESAKSGIQSERMQSLLNDYYVAQQRGDTLAQQAIQNEMAKAQLTGVYGGTPTLSAQNQQWQQGFSQQQFDYGKQQDAISQQQWQKEFDEDVRRFGLQYALQKAQSQGKYSGGSSSSSNQPNMDESMYKAIQLAQKDPRIQTDEYGNISNPQVLQQIINEYYSKLTGQPLTSSSNSALPISGPELLTQLQTQYQPQSSNGLSDEQINDLLNKGFIN